MGWKASRKTDPGRSLLLFNRKRRWKQVSRFSSCHLLINTLNLTVTSRSSMKKIFTSVLFFVAATAYSQVNSPWTQYYQTPYMQNPALSGIENYTDIKIGYKRQWTSFDG